MMLSRGSRGPKVKQVQRKLGITVDGIYGPVTERNVRAYQRSHGLQVDGIVGPKTWASMFGGGSGVGGTSESGAFTFGGGFVETIVGGVLLYGIFKVLMKIF